MVLEVLVCDSPKCDRLRYIRQSKERVVPAGWWMWAATNQEWVKVIRLRWWQMWRMLRMKRSDYWPLRLRHKRRILWASQAAHLANVAEEVGGDV